MLFYRSFATHSTHEATLETARPETPAFARKDAKKRIDHWKIFDRPVATVRQYNPKVDTSTLPDTLVQLARRADWSDEVVNSLPEDVSLLWVPTDDWFDATSDALHGVAVIKFDAPPASEGASPRTYSILYSPHGAPASCLAKTLAALDTLPHHECLALIHHFDEIYIPPIGSVFRGLQGGADLAMAAKAKFWFRTHGEQAIYISSYSKAEAHTLLCPLCLANEDELKAGEGLIAKISQRVRNSAKEAQELVPDDIEVVELPCGESFDLFRNRDQ